MNLQGRAIYNLIRLNWLEDPTIPTEPWQVEDLRALSEPELFKRLKAFHIDLNEKSFIQYAEAVDTPEELAEMLGIGEEDDDERFDQVYLLVFELWRGLLNKQSLSILCDKLDHLIYLYDHDQLVNEEVLQEALGELERVLDENVDQGGKPHAIFAEISTYCAHDLENFIYDYLADLIETGETLYASELIDGFSGYISDTRWFEFLRAGLLFETDEEESTIMFERLLNFLKEEPQLDLLLEIARFFVKRGNPKLFLRVIQEMHPLISSEQDFQETLALACQFSQLLELDDLTKKLQALLNKRQNISLDEDVKANDSAVTEFFDLLKNLKL